MTPRHRAPLASLATLAALALVISACGDGDPKAGPSASPSVDLPTGNVEIPAGLTLTKAGTTLSFGEPATVAYEPNTQRSSVLSLSVDSVQTGRIADFAAYQLDDRTKSSTPYYVRVTVQNVGTGDLSRAAVPLLAVDTRNTLIQPSSFNNTFAPCPSTPLPAGFVEDKQVKGCLVFLVPSGGTLTEMSFRPLQAFEPITWEGTITPVKGPKDAKNKNKNKNKGKKSKNKKKQGAP